MKGQIVHEIMSEKEIINVDCRLVIQDRVYENSKKVNSLKHTLFSKYIFSVRMNIEYILTRKQLMDVGLRFALLKISSIKM